MKHYPKRLSRKGFTLVELMVAMSIFVIVTTLAVGGFVAVNSLKAVAMTQKETQQKIRISLELLTRYAKQAEFVKLVTPAVTYYETSGVSSNAVEFYFNLSNYDNTGTAIPVTTKDYRRGVKFAIIGTELRYYECTTVSTAAAIPICTNWIGGNNILGSEISLRSSPVVINPSNPIESRFTMNKKATDLVNPPAVDQDTFAPPTLTIKLIGDIGAALSDQNYKDSFELETRVLLSRLK